MSIGIAFVMIRSANLESNKPIDGALISYITATVCYVPFILKKDLRSNFNYSLDKVGILVFAGLLSGTAQTSRFMALGVSPVAIVASIIAINPLVTIILSFFINKKEEILNRELIIGAIVAVIGVILVTLAVHFV